MADEMEWIKTGIEVLSVVGTAASVYIASIVRRVVQDCNLNISKSQVFIMEETRKLVEQGKAETVSRIKEQKAEQEVLDEKLQTAQIELRSHVAQDQERFAATAEKIVEMKVDIKDVKQTIEKNTDKIIGLINRNFNERNKP